MGTIAPSFLIRSSLNWQVTKIDIQSRMNSNSARVRFLTSKLLGLSAEQFSHRLIIWKNCVPSLACSVFIGPSSTSVIIRSGIRSGTSLNSGQIRLFMLEILALECQKTHIYPCVMQCVYFFLNQGSVA